MGVLHLGAWYRRVELSHARRGGGPHDGVLARVMSGTATIDAGRRAGGRVSRQRDSHAPLSRRVYALCVAALLGRTATIAVPPFARSLRAALLAAGGGAALTLILASVNRATGGDWLFFLPQIEHSWTLSQPGNDRWWLGLTDWIPSARHLIIPVLLMIASLPVLALRPRGPDRRLAIALAASAWMAFAVMCFFQFVRRMTMLDYSYMSFPLYLHAFPAIGAMLAAASVGARSRRPAIATATASVVMLGTLLFLMPGPLPHWLSAASAAIRLRQAPPIAVPCCSVSREQRSPARSNPPHATSRSPYGSRSSTYG